MKFDDSYELLADLYGDSSFPKKSTDQLKNHLKQAIAALEQGQREPAKVQKIFDKVSIAAAAAFKDLKAASRQELRDILASDVLYVIEWFELDLDVEDAMRELNF